MSRRRLACVLLFVIAACGDDASSSPDAGDAGVDASVDAGARDARADASLDAQADAAGPDASGDGGPWFEAAGWEPLPGLPEGCVIERATNPEVLHHGEWVSCGDGCQRLLPDARVQRAFDADGAWYDGARGYFWIVQGALDDPMSRRTVVLATTLGEALAAWRGPEFRGEGVCQVGPTAAGDGHAAMLLRIRVGTDAEMPTYHAPITGIASSTTPVGVIAGTSGQDTVVSSTTVATELQPEGIVKVFEAGRETILGGTPEVPGIAQGVELVGRDVFFSEVGSNWRVAHGSIDRPASVFFQIPGVDVRMFRTDGASMAWLQCYDFVPGAGYGRVELWTAPFTADPSAVSARRLRDFPEYRTYTQGGGYIAWREVRDGPQRVELFSLEDGARRTFIPPDSAYILGNPLYISADELVVEGRFADALTLFRVRIDSLAVDG